MAAADVQKRIDELTQKLNQNKITVQEFNKQYEKLRKELDKELKIYLETRVREPEKTSEQSIAELADAFRRAGATGYVQEQAEKIKKEIQESGENIGEQNLEDLALRRATQRYKRQILPKLAASTEYQKLIEPSKFVSTIVDPKKGLVFDPKTGDVRKAGDVEFGLQSLKPQVVYSAAELEPVGKGAEAKLLRQQIGRLRQTPLGFAPGMSPEQAKAFSEGLIEQEKRAKKLQEEFEKDPKYRVVEEAGYVVESPLAYAFGMLNTGSAFNAPLVKGIQDLITPGVKTRPERYKKTERKGLLSQFLTNVATRQGMFDQFQAQLLPPDAEVDGVTALFLQEGSPLTFALGVATEFTAGITPVGTVADIAKAAKAAGKFVTPSLMKYAQQVEIDTALRAADAKKTVKEIKKELKAEGKDVTPVTLRGRAAETIGDVYAAERVLQDVVNDATITVGQVKQMTKNSPTVQAVTAGLNDADSIRLAQGKILELSESLRQKTIRGKAEVPTLRRAYDVGEDVRLLIRERKKPRFDADLVRRNVRGAAVRVDPSATPVAPLIKESYTRPLTDLELEELANGLKDIKAERFIKPEETIYEATRSAVAEVLRDNFLKNIPDDMIAVGRSVVVPANKVTKRAFRKNPELEEYLKRRQDYMEHTSTTAPQGREYRLTEDAQKNIRALFEAQDSVVPFKIDEALNASEFSILQNKIAEDLAIELLDGIRLQQGSLTAEFARLKGAERATLISPVSGKRSSFAISAKGLANALRIISPKRFAFLDKIFPKIQLPPTMARFTREMTEQSNRAFRQVEDRLKKIGGKDEVARQQLLADEIERSMQQGIQVKMNRMEQQAPRAQEGIADVFPEQMAAVSDVVVPFKRQRVEELGELEAQRAQKLGELESRLDYDYAAREAKYETQREDLIERQEQQRLRQLIRDVYQEGELESKLIDDYAAREAKYKSQREDLINRLEQKRLRQLIRDAAQEGKLEKENLETLVSKEAEYKSRQEDLIERQEQQRLRQLIKDVYREQKLLDNYIERYAGKEKKYKEQLDEMISRHDEALRIQTQAHEANLEKLKRTLESNIRRLYRDKNEIKLQRIRQEYLSKKETINNRYNRKAKQARDEYTQGLLGTRFVQPGKKPLLAEVKAAESQQTKRLKQREALKKKYDSSLKKHQETRTNELKELEDTYDPILREAYEKYQKKQLSLEEILPIIQKEKQSRIRFNNLLKKYKDIRENLIKKHLQVRNLAQHQYGRKLQDSIERQQKRMRRFEERISKRKADLEQRQEAILSRQAARHYRKLKDLRERLGQKEIKFEERAAQRKADLEQRQERLLSRQELQNKRRLQDLSARQEYQFEKAKDRAAQRRADLEQRQEALLSRQELQNKRRLEDLSIRHQGQVGRFKERTAEKVERFKERTAEQVEKKTQAQQEKRERFAQRRKIKGFYERYGRDAVDSSLETLGIKTYDELLENLNDLQNNMGEYIEAVYRADQWRTLINKFFTNPDKKFAKNSASPSYYIDQLKRRNDFDKAFLVSLDASLLDAANIMRVTPENFKLVIDRIRESAPELKKYGLSTNPLLKNQEDYFLPILEVMVDIQRTENMQSAVQRFIVEDPDLLVRVGQTYNSTAGLDAINSMASKLERDITHTLSEATRRGLLKDVEVQLLIEQCKETLFSAAMNDIWKATGRDSQIKFLQMYFTDSIQQQRLINGMSDSLINMYNENVLRSTTFDRIRSKSETILGNLVKKLERAEAITDETRPIVEKFIERVPQVIAQMEERYLFALVGKDFYMPGLFGDQVNELYSYMSRYGISEEVTLNSLKMLQPTLEYIGSSNLALIHGGDISGVFDNINSLFKNPTFEDRLKRLAMFGAPANQYATGKIVQSALSLAAAASKMSISNMLYGSIQASTRFMGFNRFTAPHIFMTTIGYGATKIQDVLKFTGVALSGGIPLLLRNVLQSVTGKTFGSIVDSNRYLYLPDDTVVIRAADTNAMRDYTAGELRQIGVDTGFEYSRAAAEFYDDQYKGLLEAMKMTPQGKMKSTIRSLYDKAVSNVFGQSNYLADFTHLQDAELRRLVFIESLKTGATVEDSVSLAKQVALDYTTLSTFEKTTISRYVRFYAFMRTMTVATINNFYRGIVGNSAGAFAPRLLRAQNTLTKESSQDFVSMTDDQRGRLYNIYAGTVDDVDLYLSGPPNPQVQAFELVGMLPLFMLGAVTDNRPMGKEEVELESAVWSTINQLVNVTKEKAFEASEATPFVEWFLKSYAASAGAYRRPFPKEFIYAAEQQGILDDVIRRYDLVKRYRTPGRPLTEKGFYYSFREGSDGLKGYRAYLQDRMLGAYTIPAAVVGVYGIGGVQKDRIAVSTRAINEYWKMRMLEEGVQSPDIRAKYLKSATIQKDMGMFQNILGMAYQLGLVTPTSSRSKKFIVDKAMRDAKRTQEKLGRPNEPQ